MEHIERVQRELKYKGTIYPCMRIRLKCQTAIRRSGIYRTSGAAAVVPVTDDGKI